MHRVLLLHGIETKTGAAEDRNWPARLEGIWERNQEIPFRVFSWIWSGIYFNWVWGVFTWLPWYRKSLNQSILDNLAEIEKYGASFAVSEGRLSVIAHSYAGTIVQTALEQGWHFHRIILLATTMDENFDWKKYEKQFDSVLVCWSPADNITPHSTYGMQGKVGPLVKHPRVESMEVAGQKHFDWINPDQLRTKAEVYRHFLIK